MSLICISFSELFEIRPEVTAISSVIIKLKMVNNASELNAIHLIHGHTLELSILELQDSCYQKHLFENTDPAFSWTFNSERNNIG